MCKILVREPLGLMLFVIVDGVGKHSEFPRFPYFFDFLQLPEPLSQEHNGGTGRVVNFRVTMSPHGM